jgi:hypothetical protein
MMMTRYEEFNITDAIPTRVCYNVNVCGIIEANILFQELQRLWSRFKTIYVTHPHAVPGEPQRVVPDVPANIRNDSVLR